ncbi:MAG TPA: Hsp20 family protein [Hyphomicrobiaceae bacterium]|nr:Hsp20 family protein [Hyphomicrobiaceae bacterium]
MATLDFTPLFRSTIGFDQVPSLLTHALEREESGYPPYNIEKLGDDRYRIVMAVAGFAKDDIEVVQDQNRLTVRGRIKQPTDTVYLHRGIATRAFERSFDLADYVEVTDATMGEGLLVIALKRELPEALKPRTIPINSGTILPLGRKANNGGERQSGQVAA